MSLKNPPWSRDELILALDLYFTHGMSGPMMAQLSDVLRSLPTEDRPDPERFRNAAGVGMKLGNFQAIDPNYAGKGLMAYSKQDAAVFHEFVNDRARLHDLAEAIKAALAAPIPPPNPPEDREAPEGAVLRREHLKRERNAKLVSDRKKQARQAGKLRCEACNFCFEEMYGELGQDFIECHHTIPVASLRPGQKTRLQDLVLLCSNCHRMIHRSGCMSIDALKLLLSN